MKIEKKYLLVSFFLFLVGIWIQGCILSGTYVIVYEIDDTIVSTQDSVNSAYVDLSDNDVWEDHKDNVKYVDEVGFTFKVENRNTTDSATGQLYITNEPDLDSIHQIRANATLVVDGILAGPGETRHVLWNESMKYIVNLDVLKDQVESGTFYLYGTCRDTPFDVEFFDIVAVITVTAGI